MAIYAFAGALGVGAGFLVLAGLFIIWERTVDKDTTHQLVALVALGPPAILAALGVATSIFTGLVGRVFFERTREWWSRLNAWLLLLASAWAAWGLLSFLTLPLLRWLHAEMGTWISLVGTGWIGSLFASIFLRKPEAASEKSQLRVEQALNAAAVVFVAGLLVAVAALTSGLLMAAVHKEGKRSTDRPLAQEVAVEFKADRDRVAYYVSAPRAESPSLPELIRAHLDELPQLRRVTATDEPFRGIPIPWVALMLLASVLLVFGMRVDINKFSLHNLYKNRLVRCYLGASNPKRNEQPFVGLDDGDDFPLRALGGDGQSIAAQRPMHIINAALNISQGANLAWQERKAASFVFTPLHCGFSLARTQGDSTSMNRDDSWAMRGYRPTESYACEDPEEAGFSLGMAMATSGAAVSPNMGQATRPARAFVLTMFNVRLGRWSPNPMGNAWRKPSPRFGLVALIQELFGYSNERRNFVYLSDGGHFDNLGLYELVRRHCSVIFAVDAGADPKRRFGDLAESIRKCRIDLGVEIDLPLSNLKPQPDDGLMRANQGFEIGDIRYFDGRTAKLVIIKPTLSANGDEPVDLLHYATQNPPFPQETTADQFFGESQFESYRRLGLHIAEQCLQVHGSLLPFVATTAKPVQNTVTTETPTRATRWLAWLFHRDKLPRHLPPRDGSLVDALVLAGLLTLLIMTGLLLLSWAALDGAGSAICSTSEACIQSLSAMLPTGVVRQGLVGDPVFWFLTIDCLFVATYTSFFVMTFVVATRSPEGTRPNRRLHWVLVALCLLAVATAVADYYENFGLLGQLAQQFPSYIRTADLAFATTAKFVLSCACVVAALASSRRVFSTYRRRWTATPMQAIASSD